MPSSSALLRCFVPSRRRPVPPALACLALVALALGASTGRAFAADPPPAPAPAAAPAPGTTTPAPAEPAKPEEKVEIPAPPMAPALAIVPEVVEGPPPPPGLLRGAFGMCTRDPCESPFWFDTDLRFHIRTFYFDRHNVNTTRNQAWALGGWLQYTSGWWRDFFQIGAALYTSQPLYAPDEFDGTTLLATGQEEITVLGQAFARFRYKDAATLTAYRHSVNTGYVGPQDNRMIPNTFEGVTVHGDLGEVYYDVGYLWDMKPRNRDDFIAMGSQAGVNGSEEGLAYGSLVWTPNKCWEVYAGDFYTNDIFNTAFVYAKRSHQISSCLKSQWGVQYTDQRSIGAELLGEFDTWNAGAGARFVWSSGWTVGMAFHATGEEASIRSPYGTWPGWLSLIETDFDRANEKAFGVAVKYDFGKGGPICAPGLLAVLAYAHGWDRETPGTGASLPDTDEFDFDVTWDVPRVKGLQLRFRNAYVESGGPDTGYQFRFIVNWDIDLL